MVRIWGSHSENAVKTPPGRRSCKSLSGLTLPHTALHSKCTLMRPANALRVVVAVPSILIERLPEPKRQNRYPAVRISALHPDDGVADSGYPVHVSNCLATGCRTTTG